MSDDQNTYPAWFPDDQHGYSIAICRCAGGPHLGGRKMGTPCRCERCGFMTQEQFNFLRAEWETGVLRQFIGGIPDGDAADWAPDYVSLLAGVMIHARSTPTESEPS